ncbi:hypothetical protein GGR50DRAFT_669390 [Xylaria sp. CBS 124048]|nr:hypothetical protein GGR50DRAFT_669390 [Xylaria sp. CBS 124048]
MPFPFRHICDLLQQIDDEGRKSPAKQAHTHAIVEAWFQKHRAALDAPDCDACAVLSTLLPERRTDRVYGIQAPRLQSIFGGAYQLGASRVAELRRWTRPGSGIDLADCVEGILRRTPNSRDDTTHLTVEQIDGKLARLAAASRFSSPAVQALHGKSKDCNANKLLGDIYKGLGSRDAKWFTRLILKNYQPVVLKERDVLRNYHPLLPQMMEITADFSTAIASVRHLDEKANEPDTIASILKPRLGTKVGRQKWLKGRSIKNCMNMARGRVIACEQKMDGEYCQIHIDLSKPDCIQIFSKSGKDSTKDRTNLHQAIRDSLKLGSKDCPFTKGCILEGELVVYSTKEKKILPFHKIRKHVSRSGVFLGTKNDSQPHKHEHLMIIYYDLLLIDDESLLGVKNSERYRRLGEIVTTQQGHAELVSRTTIRTSDASAAQGLRELFAQCITSRGEGLVLKPDEAYMDFRSNRKQYDCFNIKLKKEYVQGWGDVGDFAVIGASYDAAKAKEYKIPNVKWTHFYIGCLENRDQARAETEIPIFRVTNIVELTGPVLSAFWAQGSPMWVLFKDNTSIRLNLCGGMLEKKPTVVFPCPLVFDMRCFSFDKEPNTDFWSMRFPQVSKVHYDRSYHDTISFSELQDLAEAERPGSGDDDSQEMLKWIKALEKMDGKGSVIHASSQENIYSDIPPSPSSSTTSQLTERRSGSSSPPSPRYSAVETIAAPKESQHAGPMAPASNRAKRPAKDDSRSTDSPKRCRGLSSVSSNDSSQSTATNASPIRKSHREPLSQVDNKVTNTRRPDPEHSPPTLPPTNPLASGGGNIQLHKAGVSSPAAYYTASERASSPATENAKIQQKSPAETPGESKMSESEAGSCSLVGHKCALANCSVLLSPCISGYALITDDLLARHGITAPVLDLREWDTRTADIQVNKSISEMPASSFPSTTSTPSQSSPANIPTPAFSGSKQRKICLVESKRKDATENFFTQIRDANLRRKDGKRERVTAYDWRVLESITEFEEGSKSKTSSRGTDPWRRFYVGVV